MATVGPNIYKNTFSESGKHIMELSFSQPISEVELNFSGNSITKVIYPKFVDSLNIFANCKKLKEVIFTGVLKKYAPYYYPSAEESQNQQNLLQQQIAPQSEKVGGPFYGCDNLEKVILLQRPELPDMRMLLNCVTNYTETNTDFTGQTWYFLENAYIYVPDQYVNELNNEVNFIFETVPEGLDVTFINKKDNFVRGLSEL